MRASTKRILSVLLSGVFLIGVIAVSSSLISPVIKEINEIRSVLFAKNNLLTNQQTAVAEVQQLIGQFQEFSQIQKTITLAMPLDNDATKVLSQLDALAESSGVLIRSFRSEPQALERTGERGAVRRRGVVGVDMQIEGSYQGLKNFLRLLETNVRVFDVESFTFDQAQLGSDNYELTLETKTYYQE